VTLNSRRLSAADRRYLWHPFTQMQEYARQEPLIIKEGRGAWLKDIHGKRYLDGVSSLWVNVHGHRKGDIDRAIRRQLDKIAHSTLLGLSHVPAIELAAKLVKIAPRGLNHVFYSDSGSEAMEIALKMAYHYWHHRGKREKKIFVSLENAYHGDTIGAMSLGHSGLFHAPFRSLMFKTLVLPSPYPYRCRQCKGDACLSHCLKALEKILKKRSGEIVAIVVEPLVQGAAGMIMAPSGYLSGVRKLATRYRVLLIADEVATGFGRTGKMFACEHEGVVPDIMALAKGITAGYLPLAATLATDTIYKAFLGSYEERKTFFHGHSYTGNPLGCAAALASLRVFERENTLRHVRSLSRFLTKRLEAIGTLPHVGDIRQRGLMVGIELVRDKNLREIYPWEEKIGVRVAQKARDYGVLLRPLGSVMVLMPPLSIRQDELGAIVDTLRRSIEEVTR
jgi:adenosylmethionine-8-amino-7-oxononanoate transaminase